MPFTSPLGHGLAVEGLLLQVGNGASPEIYTTIANVQDWNEPAKADTVDVTNVGDVWRSKIATLLDMGAMKFKIFWEPTDATQGSAAGSGSVASGLRYIFKNRVLTNFAIVYPDGLQSTDYFTAYVTGYAITGKVAGVFEAEIELTSSGSPTLV